MSLGKLCSCSEPHFIVSFFLSVHCYQTTKLYLTNVIQVSLPKKHTACLDVHLQTLHNFFSAEDVKVFYTKGIFVQVSLLLHSSTVEHNSAKSFRLTYSQMGVFLFPLFYQAVLSLSLFYVSCVFFFLFC